MDGILNINKPGGMTSYRAVAAVKRLTGERHTGHAGTLDPDATGVLPICLGKGTRIVEYLMDAGKTYRATVELGKSTDTYDAAGKITGETDASHIRREKVEKALEGFRGRIQQIPPMHSALKHRGQPLYNLARAGITVERKSRAVTVYRLELTDWQPPFLTLEIDCSKGTYIRSLANDLGEALGCGAYLKALVRTRYGAFTIEDAISLEALEEQAKQGSIMENLYPIDSVLQDMPPVTVDDAGEKAIKTGSAPNLNLTPEADAKYCRAYNANGDFLAILRYNESEETWRPKKVFI